MDLPFPWDMLKDIIEKLAGKRKQISDQQSAFSTGEFRRQNFLCPCGLLTAES